MNAPNGNGVTQRPDVEAILKPLAPFQRRTVDHAFERLFTAPDSTSRFLVADEVGLGKTLVARGVIARAVEHLWSDVDRIDVVYICSNESIARSNLPKLRVSGGGRESSFALATRLTLLATELAAQPDGKYGRNGANGHSGLIGNKLNFVSFTPGTSFNMGGATGNRHERRVLFRLLEPFVSSKTALMNMLQCGVTNKARWRKRLRNDETPIEPGIRKRFQVAVEKDDDLRACLDSVLGQHFTRHRQKYRKEVRRARKKLIGELRELLATVCIDALEPDLVILDEFQRFSKLLSNDPDRDAAADLAQKLFSATTPEGNPVRTLLLSATPYKLYTADAEIEDEDHYKDFLDTTRFLLGHDESKVEQLKAQLSDFGGSLKRAAAGRTDGVLAAKHSVEATLRKVMARTERVAASDERDAMVEERQVELSLTVSDVRQYLAADALFQAVGDSDPLVYWKAAPYLAHFMQGYKVNERLNETLTQTPEKIAQVLTDHDGAFLRADALRRWAQIDPANAKLRELTRDLDHGLWKLLWMPPTVPYWPLDGAFRGHEGRTKTLIFSAWNVVPDVVSAVLSYEAERRKVGSKYASYADITKQSQLLYFTDDGQRSRHRLALLLLPCLVVADRTHPLLAPAGVDRRAWVREQVEVLLDDPRLPNPTQGRVDDRWEWAVTLVLDPGLREFLREWKADPERLDARRGGFEGYLDDFIDFDPESLGRRPEKLADLLTEVALGSPAILASRTLASARLDDDARRRLAVEIADAFWPLFNRPSAIALLEQLAEAEPERSRDENIYWRLVLRYCRDGNLQAVLDETWHLTWGQASWSDDPREVIAGKCAQVVCEMLKPKTPRVHARLFGATSSEGDEPEVLRVRADFAIRLSDAKTDEHALSQEAVRAAFNSPFLPFVLASTSVGQEGLDFHPWCHRLVHWNLPGNPVDLEQREGRVHRYKGHAVRKNVAEVHGLEALDGFESGDDLWERIFDSAYEAARGAGESDLVPFWMAPGPHRVQRHVPMLPYTKEVEGFRRLKRQLAAYRVVFGQPRQEEFLALLDRSAVGAEELREWAIDLAPPGGLVAVVADADEVGAGLRCSISHHEARPS